MRHAGRRKPSRAVVTALAAASPEATSGNAIMNHAATLIATLLSCVADPLPRGPLGTADNATINYVRLGTAS